MQTQSTNRETLAQADQSAKFYDTDGKFVVLSGHGFTVDRGQEIKLSVKEKKEVLKDPSKGKKYATKKRKRDKI